MRLSYPLFISDFSLFLIDTWLAAIPALSEAEQLILARLGGRGEDLGSRLVKKGRSIVRLKGEIVQKMFQLDKESLDFFKEKRDAIIKDYIRTMPKREYSSRKLPEKLDDLNGKNVIRRAALSDQGPGHKGPERGVQPLDSKERSVEILFIGSCVAVGIDDERRAAFSGAILLIGGIAK
ncbi:hypothetical protein HAX54_032039 [Datura stramonium]|uniref:Uncharacterized protein n=1 Tax=Datura stramonium TaxID=4076 RepID=A0ABS8VC61_DATST|nr:hypothetical protein [Datura stramonium]